MKFAVIKTGGKQYRVAEGDVLKVEKLPIADESEAKGGKIVFDQVLLAVDGDKLTVGQPVVAKAKVEAEHLETAKGDKVLVFKYKSKVRYRVKRGHRQTHTKVKITKLDF